MKDVITMIQEAYIQTYGPEKWQSLTDQQRHDVIMTLARDMLEALDA
jgi:hypothetical protein